MPALRDANVPIFIQAYPDEIGKMDFESRRDAFCGKFSIEDMFNQYGIRYTVFAPHVAHPLSDAFAQNLRDFAAVCNVVKRCRRYVIGGIGARTTAFKTVRCDELALEKYGITVESHDLIRAVRPDQEYQRGPQRAFRQEKRAARLRRLLKSPRRAV